MTAFIVDSAMSPTRTPAWTYDPSPSELTEPSTFPDQEAGTEVASFERALADLEAELEAAQQLTGMLTQQLRRARTAAHVGNIKVLEECLSRASASIRTLAARSSLSSTAWSF